MTSALCRKNQGLAVIRKSTWLSALLKYSKRHSVFNDYDLKRLSAFCATGLVQLCATGLVFTSRKPTNVVTSLTLYITSHVQ